MRTTDKIPMFWPGFAACIFSGIIWYAFICCIITVLRFLGVTIQGIWPLHP